MSVISITGQRVISAGPADTRGTQRGQVLAQCLATQRSPIPRTGIPASSAQYPNPITHYLIVVIHPRSSRHSSAQYPVQGTLHASTQYSPPALSTWYPVLFTPVPSTRTHRSAWSPSEPRKMADVLTSGLLVSTRRNSSGRMPYRSRLASVEQRDTHSERSDRAQQ